MGVTDIKLDEDGDLLIEDGDFVLHESDEAHIEHILISNKGTWRQFPAIGVGLRSFLSGPLTRVIKNGLAKLIRVNLTFDGFKIRKLNVDNIEDVKLDATRRLDG